MDTVIQSALISVYSKEGLEPIVRRLMELNVKLFSTGGTQLFIEQLGIPCTSVEKVTGFPSILGGRVKTLHPKIFGGILARRNFENDQTHVIAYDIPLFDLVIVDFYPFEETLTQTTDEQQLIEKIDIGGVSLIRAAAKNFEDVCVIASKNLYPELLELLDLKNGKTNTKDRKRFAARAFAACAHYDVAIANYFNKEEDHEFFQFSAANKQILRYGENPHQNGSYYGNLKQLMDQLNGKELSYNNLIDLDAAFRLMNEFSNPVFAIIKHTNVCCLAERKTAMQAWIDTLACDPESAFGGIIITNQAIQLDVAEKINELFFEILVTPAISNEALAILKSKKNRIILIQKSKIEEDSIFKNILNGVLVQDADQIVSKNWQEVGGKNSTEEEKENLIFANIICKHLKSNAIAIVKNKQLIGMGCGQTSRIEALRQAIAKAQHFGFSLDGAVLASDGFFPFDDSVRLAYQAGIKAIIQPGGSVRDIESTIFCKENNMVMVITDARHFKH